MLTLCGSLLACAPRTSNAVAVGAGGGAPAPSPGVGPSVGAAPSPVVPASTAATSSTPPPPGAPSLNVVKGDGKILPKEFTVLAPITFKAKAAAVTKTLLHGDRKELWYAPDGTAFASYGNDASIFPPGASNGSKGIAVKVADPLRVAFASDSKHVAIIHARSPLTVVALATGKTAWERDQGRECATAFLSPTKVALHDESKDDHARLWHLDLTTGKATALPGERRATECSAGTDGKRFIVYADSFDAKKRNVARLVDSETGASGVLFDDVEGSIAFSPKADRICFHQGKGFLFCDKVGTAQLERLTPPRATSDVPIFDDTGKRGIFSNSVEGQDGSYGTQWWLADFDAGTVRQLVGVGPQGPTTSIAFLAGGKRIAAGGTSGVRVWDLDAATVLTVPGYQYWTVHPVASDPNAVAIGEEYGGSQEKLWLVKLPP